jgi:glycosyltransferase involved in cell wall biosynthesis
VRILFLHDNFPAQFGLLGDFLARRGAEVFFGTQREGASSPYMKVFRFKPHREPAKGVHPYAAGFEKAVLAGQAAARACFALKERGFAPDVVVAHAGWGTGMFVKDVWPETRFVGYFEWYYQPDGADVVFLEPEARSGDEMLRARARNAPILSDLVACEFGFCPTRWQAGRIPEIFHPKLKIHHDGIDTDYFAPPRARAAGLSIPGLDLPPGAEIVSYVARGMEPYRGFPQFMAAAEIIQKRRPRAHIVVVGEDRVAYGRRLPEGESYKSRALTAHDFDLTRLHFTGHIPRDQYRAVLHAASAHVYLTTPFVLSWSVLEAMSAETLVIASGTQPVREVVTHGENGVLTDFHDPAAITEAVVGALDARAAHDDMRRRARETILERYAMRDIFPQKEAFLRGV